MKIIDTIQLRGDCYACAYSSHCFIHHCTLRSIFNKCTCKHNALTNEFYEYHENLCVKWRENESLTPTQHNTTLTKSHTFHPLCPFNIPAYVRLRLRVNDRWLQCIFQNPMKCEINANKMFFFLFFSTLKLFLNTISITVAK